MTDQEVTYTTVRFHKSSGLQNPVRPEETQRPREAGHREYSVPWKLIVIVLGILCSLLLVIVAVLVTHIVQYGHEKHEQEKTLNSLNQEYHVVKKDISLKEEMLRNKSLENDKLKDSLHSLKGERKRCYEKTKIVLDCLHHAGKRVKKHWFCCGTKCYYFITNDQQWSGCIKTCQCCSLSLLTIDDEDELKFLKPQLQGDRYWIGLTHNKNKWEWQWINNGSSKLDLAGMNSVYRRGSCAFLSPINIQHDDCAKTYGCICEMRPSKFHIPVSYVKKRAQSSLQNDEVKSEETFCHQT
ncbi:killer cell lectin-like receptor 2 isoform X1 [Apodemus sylvaticus]|uniref:killer cell lectin-like receptor 2 isoform X1 n=1 Tax=Apodemus sylvaticus TaxID=10129 RepID=UPI002242C8AF|nr:killer cell lectin-like receptor 2 isoform X1 [Apodemus sylvaticus]